LDFIGWVARVWSGMDDGRRGKHLGVPAHQRAVAMGAVRCSARRAGVRIGRKGKKEEKKVMTAGTHIAVTQGGGRW
jgi:hypothetical protein